MCPDGGNEICLEWKFADFPQLLGVVVVVVVVVISNTLPKTNSSHLKNDSWKTFSFPFGIPSCQVRTVSFREGRVFFSQVFTPTIGEEHPIFDTVLFSKVG